MKDKLRVKDTGEVFTPRSLIREMLDRLPNSVWFDPNKRWLEPSAGDGNFLVEVKARLLQAGHDEIHILENMLFSIELIDDNHWALQHRLNYLIDGQPNPALNLDHFNIRKISQLTQELNDKNPYHEKLNLARDEVLFHRNHVCWSGLDYDMSFDGTQPGQPGGERDGGFFPVLEVLPIRDLGLWPETDTPDIGERYVVEKMLGKQPQSAEPKPVMKQAAAIVQSAMEKRNTTHCKVIITHLNEDQGKAFIKKLPARIIVAKVWHSQTRTEAYLVYGPVEGANQDDIKRELVKIAELMKLEIAHEFWRRVEGEAPPSIQIGPSEMPSIADYIRVGHSLSEAKRRRAAGLQP